MSVPTFVPLCVQVRIIVCACAELSAPHAYLLLDRSFQPEPASFSLQLLLTHLSCLIEWATKHEVDISPDPEVIMHHIQHLELPFESVEDDKVFEALKANGDLFGSFVCEQARRQAFEFHNAALKMAS